jgi:hypothetical protein
VEATVEPPTNTEGKQANTIAEKEEMFRGESFSLNNENKYYELPPTGLGNEHITEQSVERPMFSYSVKKSTGIDKLSFGALQLLWKWNRTTIVGLTKGVVQTGNHPAVWKYANGMMI